MNEPLTLTFEIDCAPAHAFEVWTSRFDQWWPRGHSVSGHPVAIVLEPRVGGRIYERAADGTEIDWGEVTETSPTSTSASGSSSPSRTPSAAPRSIPASSASASA